MYSLQSYFTVPKEIKLNCTQLLKIHNRTELQNIATNHSADIEYKNFMKIYRKCTKETHSSLTIDTTLPANNSLRYIKNILDSS